MSDPKVQRQEAKTPGKTKFVLFVASWSLGAGVLILLLITGCSKGKTDIPELADDPVAVPVTVKDLPETVPAYGIVAGGDLEVNVEKEDAPQVIPGQKAMALVGAGQNTVECRVVNILPDANLATGMAIAWLRPLAKTVLPGGDFVSAQIILRVKRRVPTAPEQAVFIRDGKTLVIVKREEKGDKGLELHYEPTTVVTGIVSGNDVEILSGLEPKDEVILQGGIGYLYPDFQSQAGD